MYVGTLITQIRTRTGKTRYSVDANGVPTEGVPQSLVLQFINDAKDFIQAMIVSTGSTICDTDSEISIVAGTSRYQVDDNVHMGNKIRNVQYSFDGETRNYRDLPQVRDEERSSRPDSTLRGYIRRGLNIEVVPPPLYSRGKIRPEYPRQWDDLNLRCGTISDKNNTTLVFEDDANLNAPALSTADYICIVSLAGEVLYYNIPVVSYDAGTFTLTIESTPTSNSIVGAFVTVGEYTTTHTDFLPSKLILQYIKVESQMRMFDQSTSVDAIRENAFLRKIYDAIIEGYEDELLDETDIPIQDPFAMS